MTEARPLPPQVHAASLHGLLDLYVQAGRDGGDLATLGPLRLLRDRVEYLLAEHARLAREVDGQPWREVADALGVSRSAMPGWHRAVRASRLAAATPRPARAAGS